MKFKNTQSQFEGKNFPCKTYRGNLIPAVSHARGNSDTSGDEWSESKGNKKKEREAAEREGEGVVAMIHGISTK